MINTDIDRGGAKNLDGLINGCFNNHQLAVYMTQLQLFLVAADGL